MTRHLQFLKMHGLGNDFIVIDGINQRVDWASVKSVCVDLCRPKFGIGADGIILISPSDQCDLKMCIVNADGSTPEMCGNGIRCLVKAAFDEKLVDQACVSVETDAGRIVCTLDVKDGLVFGIEVDMGIPQHGFETTKGLLKDGNLIGVKGNYDACFISMGNPHSIIFQDDWNESLVLQEGPVLENNTLFNDRSNIEFVNIIDRDHLRVEVWERGSGRTLACGTGACASVVAGVIQGFCDRLVEVQLPGGRLQIEWQDSDGHVIMTGPAVTVYRGDLYL